MERGFCPNFKRVSRLMLAIVKGVFISACHIIKVQINKLIFSTFKKINTVVCQSRLAEAILNHKHAILN